ncbi:hypothetical protein PMAYCL1PPCAC_21104, partial [Pristionchus mayeri]
TIRHPPSMLIVHLAVLYISFFGSTFGDPKLKDCSTLHDITWEDGESFQTKVINLTMCKKGKQLLEVQRPENSSKSIRVSIESIDGEQDSLFHIDVFENGMRSTKSNNT